MRIRIEKAGIFGKDGEYAVGTELDVNEEPTVWGDRYTVISGAGGKTAVINPDNEREDLKKQADELGIEYAKNIPTDKLKELIDAKLAA